MPASDDHLLLASIHDVGPMFEGPVDRLVERVSASIGTPRFAMLVVPDHWGQAPIRPGSPFAGRLRRWSEAGIELFVHGWYHRDAQPHRGIAAIKARWMTAREGEFLGLDADTARKRMEAGRKLLEDVTGRPPAGFIAPAWLYGEGALSALGTSAFALAEDHMRVWAPASGQVLARGPVITWASRSRLRTASSLLAAAAGRRALRRQRVIRVAVHPGDVTKPAIMASISTTLTVFTKDRRVARYADLLT